MKKALTLLFLTLASLALCVSLVAQPRKVTSFDSGWQFRQDKGSWQAVTLPHDWSVEGAIDQNNPGGGRMGFFPSGIGWYRKTFDVPGYAKSKLYFIEFDGVYMNSTVKVNGVELGTWPYGYTSFAYDLTPVLKARGNVIEVKVDNSLQPNSRWYTGSGIYRHVRLVETGLTRFDRWGVFNYTESVVDGNASVMVESTLTNGLPRRVEATVRQTVLDAAGKEVARIEEPLALSGGEQVTLHQQVDVTSARLWDVEDPYLYTLRSEIYADGRKLDQVDSPMGIRTMEYDVDKGFFLNGKHYKMKGVNLHHDAGPVGAAVPERVWERRLEILKESGCNAIRTAHNPPAPEFLDLCDRMGFLVMDEAFDCWQKGKNEFDYNKYYDQWYERDLKAMVARDRNHPSVVMWSVGNEIPDQMTEVGASLARTLIGICHQLDPTRPVTSGNDNIASNTPATPEFLAEFADDIVGYNYVDRWRTRRELMYSIDKAAFPDRRVVGTETGGNGGSRGDYSSRRGAMSNLDTEMRWKFTLNYDYVIGDFMWTGIDYYGESRWPSKGFVSGYLDNCGFKKDGFWFFQSIWTDKPVLHLFPHWNWQGREGEIMRVACYTNCDEVELFVNGKSYGKKVIEFPRFGMNRNWGEPQDRHIPGTTTDLHLEWDVEYQPGEIKAVGVKDGKTFEEVIRTFGEPAGVRLTVDRDSFRADPSDVAHVTVEIVDKDGQLCKTASNRVRLTVSGARLIGNENGNMRDLSSVKSPERDVWCGMSLAILAADKAGTVTVKAESEGLAPAEITFKAL